MPSVRLTAVPSFLVAKLRATVALSAGLRGGLNSATIILQCPDLRRV